MRGLQPKPRMRQVLLRQRSFALLLSCLFFCPIACIAVPVPNGSEEALRRNEMLVPVNSTSALICEPVFNGHGAEAAGTEARWMRDGREVARVNGHSNAVLGAERRRDVGGATTLEPIPQIGFLVIANTRPQDEGEYWCERLADGQQGERTRLRVAYLRPFGDGRRPRLASSPEVAPRPPQRGQPVVLDCPHSEGVPPPMIGWLFNGERLDFAAQNAQMVPNGSLLLHNFSANQSGFYACEAANFAGRSVSAQVYLGPPARRKLQRDSSSSSLLVECLSAYVRNGVLWFLIGCLTTSCVVLAYILGALFLYRLYSLRDRHHRWRRTLFSVPGFRKAVAPMGDERGVIGEHPAYESAAI